MCRLPIAIAAFLILTVEGQAADWSWDRADIVREGVSAGLTVVDWGQTRGIRNHNGMIELNPILGWAPTNSAIGNYFGSVLVLHPIISALLPKDVNFAGFQLNPRLAWQYFYLGVESTAIISNFNGGLRLAF